MFTKVLIANRGAVACRIIRTLRALGVRSVAVYSEADALSLHVAHADESRCIGAGPAAEGYLNIDAILAAARDTGAQAIHPGYGFLSESADFADACARAGFVFIGPTPAQMRAFGLKHLARAHAQLHGVPSLPGSRLLAGLDAACTEARRLGYPVMLKNAGGGGGAGLRVCVDEAALVAAFEPAKRHAEHASRTGGIYLEKFLADARHIEVQIFGDGRGHVVALGERDCSLQRRHQKIVEETPAPALPADLRRTLHESAVRLAQAVGYQSAGTVEFLYDATARQVYLLEINTRLQVEHGITEEVTGIDLVAWMVRQAAGELDLSSWTPPAPRAEAVVSIEVRLYAEDPNKNFQPSAGVLTEVVFPADARVETWVDPGVEVSSFYDPLLAKIIVSGPDRAGALARLRDALGRTRVAGIETNLAYLRQVVATPDFAAGALRTRWLERFTYAPCTVDVLEPGTQTTVQDFPGRVGYWAVGVPPSGPMDDLAFRLANRLLGNAPDAAALELTLAGPTLKFNVATTIALTGAAMDGDLDGQTLAFWCTLPVRAGAVLRLRGVRDAGCRAYLAVAGGFDVPLYLGSRATFTLGRFGGHAGRALRPGDVLHLTPAASAPVAPAAVPASSIPVYGHAWTIAVLYGPQAAPEFFTEEFVETFFRTEWRVHYNSNRLGIRLIGPTPGWARPDGGEAGLHPSNIHDNPYAIGTINFTGDMPVILGKDGPSLGGFVCPATVVRAELWKIGQLRPGDTVRFACTSLAEALAAERAGETAIESLQGLVRDLAPASLISPVLHWIAAEGERPEVVYRGAGDKCLLIEYGPPVLDLELRFRAHALKARLRDAEVAGIEEVTPGVRSLQIRFDGQRLPLPQLLGVLVRLETELPPAAELEMPTRVLRLPLAFDASSTRAAIEKYRQSVRAEAPWLPGNEEFVRRINGLDSIADVRAVVFHARYLVLGLGDVYLGAPCAVPVDPRHRLMTTKYNPARTWTAEGEVGIGGVYLCVYGMESPGGYQLIGRTMPVWTTFPRGGSGVSPDPWLLRTFDQIQFYPMPEAELIAYREAYRRGQVKPEVVHTVFSVREHRAFLEREADDIAVFRERQARAFLAERARWVHEEKSLVAAGGELGERVAAAASSVGAGEGIVCPISGSVWTYTVKAGDRVRVGDRIAIVEAMKMEVVVESAVDGVIVQLTVAAGAVVSAGQVLAVVRAAPADGGPPSLGLPALREAWSRGTSCVEVIDRVYDRVAARGEDHVWIHLVPRATALALAAHVDARRRSGHADRALEGVPFVIKDNIDVEGLPTTAACPEFSYIATATAPVVQRLLDAGAILIGKTNLDQFATGLVGVRSPYGAPRCVFDERYISGGSSAGSAVAVAAGLVTFALGTDTAGSGRIPAAFNNIVGWKPTRGLLSTRGVLPACRSLDCLSVLALSCADAGEIGTVVSGYDSEDPYSRVSVVAASGMGGEAFRFGIPRSGQLEFFGDMAAESLFAEAVARLEALGGERVEVDFAPFREAAELLYAGPWLAERLASIQTFLEEHPESLHPVTAQIIGGGARYSAVDTFRSFYRLEELRRVTEVEWTRIDALVLPTAGTHYTLAEVEAEPIQLNTNLGLYTNFVNLLDLCAVAVPAGFRPDGLPFGVSVIAPAFQDDAVCALAGRFHAALNTAPGRAGRP